MEVPASPALAVERALVPLEKPVAVREQQQRLRIGVPSEASNDERRVALAPYGAGILVAAGHEVVIETGAGDLAHFSDAEYAEAGAEIAPNAGRAFAGADLVAKVSPPTDGELDLLQEKQTLMSALHLGGVTPDFLRRLMELRITGIGFEFIAEPDGTLPIVRMMHEITGTLAVQTAARLLESAAGGRGVVLGGISGIPPSTVVILGAGVVGEWAARAALGYGAHVTVLDTDLSALRSLEHYLDRRITTAMANDQYVRQAVTGADVVIGAMMRTGQRAPMVVSEDTVAQMKPGSVVVDVVIDQGGCIETSRPTSPGQPTYTRHGVVHYCVPNLPSNAARTASHALTNVLVPYLLDIGEAGSVNDALWHSQSLRAGTYVYRRHLTKKSLASLFGMAYRDIELLIASGI